MCNYRINDNYCYSKLNANIHASSVNLFWSDFIGIAIDFEQWNNRNVVASFRQYCNNYLYIYSNCRIVCYNCYNEYHSESKCNTNVYASEFDLFWSEFIGIANNFE